MVRFLRTTCEIFKTPEELDRYLLVERLITVGYIPSSICLAIGSLAQCGVIPYATKHIWILFLIASIYFTLANTRDLNHTIRCVFLEPHQPSRRRKRRRSVQNVNGGVRAQMQMIAAIPLVVGSLSLMNASVIAIMAGKGQESELCRRQFAAAFGMMMIGTAANAAAGISDSSVESVSNMRMIVSFQHVVASAAFCVNGVLTLPSMKPSEDGIAFQTSLTFASSLVGGVFTVLSSIMNFFYNTALLWWQEDVFEREWIKRQRRRRRKYGSLETEPSTYEYEEDDNGVFEKVVVFEDDVQEATDDNKRASGILKRDTSSRDRQYESIDSANEEPHRRGLFERVRDAVRTRDSSRLWNDQPANGNGSQQRELQNKSFDDYEESWSERFTSSPSTSESDLPLKRNRYNIDRDIPHSYNARSKDLGR